MWLRYEPIREFSRTSDGCQSPGRVRQIPVDAYRRGDEFMVSLELPGVDPGSIQLTVEKDLLTVRATQIWARSEGDDLQIAERAQVEFSRQLFLGERLDRDSISAIYHDGVLMITIPVTERSKPKKVEVVHVGSVADAVEAATVSR